MIKSFFQNMWNKVRDWVKQIWNESWTRALAWTAGVPSTVLLALSYVNGIVTDPTFTSYLNAIEVPRSVTIAISTLSILMWLAHGRKNDE